MSHTCLYVIPASRPELLAPAPLLARAAAALLPLPLLLPVSIVAAACSALPLLSIIKSLCVSRAQVYFPAHSTVPFVTPHCLLPSQHVLPCLPHGNPQITTAARHQAINTRKGHG
jgi:hypothetical protein